MMLFFGQPMSSVLEMTPSDSRDVFEGKTFKTWKKVRDHDLKMTTAVIERLDGVARQVANLAKVMSRR